MFIGIRHPKHRIFRCHRFIQALTRLVLGCFFGISIALLIACVEEQTLLAEKTTYDCTQVSKIDLADLQQGVCQGTRKACTESSLNEPDYKALIEAYEAEEISCDQQDNDCDGRVDEGVCQRLNCHSTLELCGDMLDNDCDQKIDEDCQGCIVSEELCDGMDNDCNGRIDDVSDQLISCGLGACVQQGRLICENGQLKNTCVPMTENQQPELCVNGIDNDCDGVVDENALNLEPCPSIQMIYIRSGRFTMGNRNGLSNEKPEREVSIEKAFYISQGEISVSAYQQCVQYGACDTLTNIPNEPCTAFEMSSINSPSYPINCVTWYQARQFAQWLGGDLPSEAQWEYVAKNQELNTLYPWGNQEPSYNLLNYHHTLDQVSQSCQFPYGNTFSTGVCDMLGNLSEWVLDEYHASYENAGNTEKPWCSTQNCIQGMSALERVVRGGDWRGEMNNNTRESQLEDLAQAYTGFRIIILE